jgi:hypothetical protein
MLHNEGLAGMVTVTFPSFRKAFLLAIRLMRVSHVLVNDTVGNIVAAFFARAVWEGGLYCIYIMRMAMLVSKPKIRSRSAHKFISIIGKRRFHSHFPASVCTFDKKLQKKNEERQ